MRGYGYLGTDKDRELRHENIIFVSASPFPSNNWHMLRAKQERFDVTETNVFEVLFPLLIGFLAGHCRRTHE